MNLLVDSGVAKEGETQGALDPGRNLLGGDTLVMKKQFLKEFESCNSLLFLNQFLKL